ALADMVRSLSTQLANLILNTKILRGLQEVPQKPVKIPPARDQVMLHGSPTSQSITFGRAFLFLKDDVFSAIEKSTVADPDAELKLLDKALQLAKKKTLELERKALAMISEADASIFNVHLMFLDDQSVLGKVREYIRNDLYSLEYAISLVFREFEHKFLQFADQTFRDRSFDLKDVMLRIIEGAAIIKNRGDNATVVSPESTQLILVAHELLPSDLIRMPVDNIMGIVCEKGGATAHVSILSKALNSPAILGVKGIIGAIRDHDEILLDGHTGRVYVRPGAQVKEHFKDILSNEKTFEEHHECGPTLTTDGIDIRLNANVSLICEVAALSHFGARGIGLYRTEFMYMVRDYMPSEEDQINVFAKIFRQVSSEVTIRVLDVGGDKPLPYVPMPHEDNPALGYRGIRLLLDRKGLFKVHLRAILRSAAAGKLKLLFPMVSMIGEIIEIREVLQEVENEMHVRGIPHAENYKIGIMLEIPSLLFMLDTILPYIDFVSIGTNDLLQYTFAIDRTSEIVGHHADPLEPAFIKIMKTVGDFFRRHPDKELAVCGEMANVTQGIPLLIGAGIHELSMPPKFIPKVAQVVKKVNSAECRILLDKAIRLNSAAEVKSEVNRFLLASVRPL
ncbi:MAG: phosphoenolpyruvate--protein phosphotransferase, partial [Victivallales bacterium]|nr:phosphoenolpyruvate--protein phosphotransferase [Victivallales bacterium]